MRALYVSTLAFFIAIFGFVFLFHYSTSGVVVEPQVLAATSSPIDQKVLSMIDEINQVRSGAGVSELNYSLELQSLADFRVKDMVAQDYYSHKTPEGYTYANYISEYSPSSTYSCENLQLQVGSDASEAVKAWINSQSHYRCLTNPNVSNVAISYSQHGDTIYDTSNQPQQMYVFVLIASNL